MFVFVRIFIFLCSVLHRKNKIGYNKTRKSGKSSENNVRFSADSPYILKPKDRRFMAFSIKQLKKRKDGLPLDNKTIDTMEGIIEELENICQNNEYVLDKLAELKNLLPSSDNKKEECLGKKGGLTVCESKAMKQIEQLCGYFGNSANVREALSFVMEDNNCHFVLTREMHHGTEYRLLLLCDSNALELSLVSDEDGMLFSVLFGDMGMSEADFSDFKSLLKEHGFYPRYRGFSRPATDFQLLVDM